MINTLNNLYKQYCPINRWKVDDSAGCETFYSEDGSMDNIPRYIIDMTTGNKYLNESKNTIRGKCFLLTLATLTYHLSITLIIIIGRFIRLIIIYDFWGTVNSDKQTNPTDKKSTNFKNNLLSLILLPIMFIGLLFSAVYGIFTPYNGRKLYARFEENIPYYQNELIAPCFQARDASQTEEIFHFFGGDPKQKDAW